MTSPTFTVRSVQAFCYRYPLSTPVVTSFGRMLNRPAVFVRVEDEDGNTGWGEVWSNFPSTGAEHRTRLVNEVLAPAISGVAVSEPSQIFEKLTQGTDVLALQCGEPGPFAQAIAGIDLAVWDLYARRRKTALWKLLGGARQQIKVYASGINPTGSRQMAEAALDRGHRALKLKIGFEPAGDRANLASLRDLVGNGMLAADANQGWSIEQATGDRAGLWPNSIWPGWRSRSAPTGRGRSGRPCGRAPTYRSPRAKISRAVSGFEQALGDDVLRVVQPDIAKWGGLTECSAIARDIMKSGKTFCPHYLGGGIGLLASAHLLAGVGGDGLLEVDSNDNPLRDRFCGPVADVRDGAITLSDDPGLGIEPELSSIEQYRTA